MSDTGARRRAVFLDRDGTLCEEMGYLNHISRFQMFPFVAPAIRRLNEARVPVIVVTNQSGVARGIFPELLVHLVHEKMTAELAAAGSPSRATASAPTGTATDRAVSGVRFATATTCIPDPANRLITRVANAPAPTTTTRFPWTDPRTR